VRRFSFIVFAGLLLSLTPAKELRARQATADLAITKTGDESVRIGGTITYSIGVFNQGPDDATNVEVIDTLPANTTFVSVATSPGGSASVEGTNVRVSFPSIPVFETGSFTLVVRVNENAPRGNIVNTASARSDALDPQDFDNTATWTTFIFGPFAGDLLISEFRLRGPNGANDEFIEIYNNADTPHGVGAVDDSSGYAIVASDGLTRCVIPNGTVLPARGHFLCTNSIGYSLFNYPAGETSTATGDATYTTDIPDNAGLALFRTANSESFNLANRLDAVGSTLVEDTLYREGTGYPALSPLGLDYAFYRDNCGKSGSVTVLGNCPTGGLPKDTDNNASDFIFVSTDGNTSGAGARLGAAGPENLSGPIQLNASFPVSLLDPCVGSSSSPNRVRDLTSDPLNNSTFGTLEFRRTVLNGTDENITRLRWRIIDITTFPTPTGIADLRARTSTPIIVTVDRSPCGSGTSNVTVQGTTLEQPPIQAMGGGFNSSLSSGTVTLDTPLPPGESLDLRFLLGVEKTGTFRFFVNVEALSREPEPIPEEAPAKGTLLRKRRGLTALSSPTTHLSGTVTAGPSPMTATSTTSTTVTASPANTYRSVVLYVETRAAKKTKVRRSKKRVVLRR
jgi:uncharacterized repeat protein (TIGR01451 family)